MDYMTSTCTTWPLIGLHDLYWDYMTSTCTTWPLLGLHDLHSVRDDLIRSNNPRIVWMYSCFLCDIIIKTFATDIWWRCHYIWHLIYVCAILCYFTCVTHTVGARTCVCMCEWVHVLILRCMLYLATQLPVLFFLVTHIWRCPFF